MKNIISNDLNHTYSTNVEVNGYGIGPGEELTGADFSGACVAGANLAGVKIVLDKVAKWLDL
jgi:uncharacterized protein YjbI with pentapeptide repeats